jgi:hypothetical protein
VSFRRTALITTTVLGLSGVAAAALSVTESLTPSTSSAPGAVARPSGQPAMNIGVAGPQTADQPRMNIGDQARMNGASGTAPARMTNDMAAQPNAGQAMNGQPVEEDMQTRVERRIADMQSKLQISPSRSSNGIG